MKNNAFHVYNAAFVSMRFLKACSRRFWCDLSVTFQIAFTKQARAVCLRIVDEMVIAGYLPSQARPGHEARPIQQPRHQIFNIQPVVFLEPVLTSDNLSIHNPGHWSIQRNYLCI